jgi:putative Mn2+ efflux pump MntP
LCRAGLRVAIPAVGKTSCLRPLSSDTILTRPDRWTGHFLPRGIVVVSWGTIFGLALALSMDAFAVAIACGMNLAVMTPRHAFRLSFHFGLFKFLMPVIGWLVGRELASTIGAFDHWVAFGLLAFVGGKMLLEARDDKDAESKTDPTRGMMLITLSLATSLDALAVGLSLAFLDVSIYVPSVIIGAVAASLTAVGMAFGNRIGNRWGRWAEAMGGCVLILIGVRIVFSHFVS